MKKLLAIIMSAMVVASMLPMMAFASEGDTDGDSEKQVQTESVSDEAQAASDDEEDYNNQEDLVNDEGEWFFHVVNGKAFIEDYCDNEYISGTFEIPSTLEHTFDKYNEETEDYEDYTVTYPVVGFDKDASFDIEDCTKLVIPASITSIEGKTFSFGYHSTVPRRNVVVDCSCGSAGEKWALSQNLDTTNGVTRSIVKASVGKNGQVTASCKKCGSVGAAFTYAGPLHFGSKKSNSTTCYLGGKFVDGFYDKSGNLLYLDGAKDFTSNFKNINKVGKHNGTITFCGAYYSGSMKASVTTVPKYTSIKKLSKGKKAFTVKWKKQTSQTTGYQIRYSTSKSMKKAKTVTVKGNKKTSKKIKKLKKKKTYYVQVRTYKKVSGKNYCSTWSSKKSVKTK